MIAFRGVYPNFEVLSSTTQLALLDRALVTTLQAQMLNGND